MDSYAFTIAVIGIPVVVSLAIFALLSKFLRKPLKSQPAAKTAVLVSISVVIGFIMLTLLTELLNP